MRTPNHSVMRSFWSGALGASVLALVCTGTSYGSETENVDLAFLAPSAPAVVQSATVSTSISNTTGQRVANQPEVPNVTVQPWDDLDGAFLAPDSDPLPSSLLEIVVRNGANNPVPNASVVVQFTNPALLCDATLLTGTTDTNGYLALPMYGGGCVMGEPLACIIKANGVTIRVYDNVTSPDFDGSAPNGVVDISDLLEFKRGFLDGSSDCHDYNNDGTVGLADLLLFGPAFTRALVCE